MNLRSRIESHGMFKFQPCAVCISRYFQFDDWCLRILQWKYNHQQSSKGSHNYTISVGRFNRDLTIVESPNFTPMATTPALASVETQPLPASIQESGFVTRVRWNLIRYLLDTVLDTYYLIPYLNCPLVEIIPTCFASCDQLRKTLWRFPKTGGTPKWMVYDGKS